MFFCSVVALCERRDSRAVEMALRMAARSVSSLDLDFSRSRSSAALAALASMSFFAFEKSSAL